MPFDGSNYDANPAGYSGTVTNPVTEILKQAWSLIDKPQKWCRNQPKSAGRRRLCSLSALHTTVREADFYSAANHVIALVALAQAMNGPGPALPSNIAAFNDSHTHAEISAAWQRAIAMSRALP